MTILQAMDDPRFFKGLFKDARSWSSWRVFLAALFGLPIEGEGNLKLFGDSTGLGKPSSRPYGRAFVVAGRRAGKSFISALVATYLASFKDWRPYLAPGERGWIMILATDKSQSGIVRRYISGFFKACPGLRGMVERETSEAIDLHNQVSIVIKPSSFRAVRGFTIVAAILEELSFWRSEESANPDKEILRAVEPALATIPGSLLLGISTPYSKSGVLWDEYRRSFGQPGDTLIWRAASRVMNPSLSQKIIDRAMRDDPESGQAEWMSEFRSDLESFVSAEVVEAVIVPGRFELEKQAGVTHVAAIDPSGGRNNSFVLAISHRDVKSGRAILDLIREAVPPFRPSSVVAEFSGILRSYGIREIESDRYAGEWVGEAFQKHDVSVKAAELTASEAYLELLPALMNGSVELLDHKRLKGQLIGLERRTRGGGKDQVSHYAGTHDDVANAVALSLLRASDRASKGFYLAFGKSGPWDAFDDSPVNAIEGYFRRKN